MKPTNSLYIGAGLLAVLALLAKSRPQWLWPVPGGETLPGSWGNVRGDGHTHWALDIMAPWGTPVLAVANGILYSTPNKLGGNAATLETPDGYRVYYAHMVGPVRPRAVKKGERIGSVGNTGNARNTDPHLHIEVLKGSQHLNLLEFV